MEWGKVDAQQMEQLTGYRESGVCSKVEVLGASDKCSYCRNGFEGVHDINANLVMPPPECDHEYGFCVAAFVPLIDDDDDPDVEPIPDGESREYDLGGAKMIVENNSDESGIRFRYSVREDEMPITPSPPRRLGLFRRLRK